MRDFDAASNLRWHRRAGFDAAFITDHNTVGPLAAPAKGWRSGVPGPKSAPGARTSCFWATVVPVDRSHATTGISLALLECSPIHRDRIRRPHGRFDSGIRAKPLGPAGYAGLGRARRFRDRQRSPKANEITRAQRDTVIALARRTNRFVVGASDIHGWGATSMVWNLVRVPGGGRRPSGSAPACSGVCRTASNRSGSSSATASARQRMAGDAHPAGRGLGDLAEHGLDADRQPGSSGSGGPGRSCGYGAALGSLKLPPR